MTSKVILLSGDHWFLEVDMKAAKMSKTIKIMLEDLDINNDNEVIPLFSIDGHILMKVVEWMEHHKDDPPKVNSPPVEIDIYAEPRTDGLSEWDLNFVNVNHLTFFAIMRAANFLNIEGLIAVTSKTMVNMIKGKTDDEIREYFSLWLKPEENSAKRRKIY